MLLVQGSHLEEGTRPLIHSFTSNYHHHWETLPWWFLEQGRLLSWAALLHLAKAYCMSTSNGFSFQIIETVPDSDWFKWILPKPCERASRLLAFFFFFPSVLNYLDFLWNLVSRFLQGTFCFPVFLFLQPLNGKWQGCLWLPLTMTLCHRVWERTFHFEASCVERKHLTPPS